MATITKYEGEKGVSYKVLIRKKGQKAICKSFSNLETAELWAKYKEDLIDELEAFEVPEQELITFRDAIHFKVKDLLEHGKDYRTINDVKNLYNLFENYMDCSLQQLDYKFYENILLEWENSNVRHGGDHKQKKGGIVNKISLSTILRRFSILGSVYSFLIKKGVNIDNHPLKFTSIIRKKLKENKNAKS